MKFSVIGTSGSAFGLLREIAASSEHFLVTGAISGALADAVTAAQLPLRLASSPEDAILEPSADAVIVAHEDLEEILRLTRAASQAGRHVIIFPPATCSPAFSFELHLILDESQQSIIPMIGRTTLPDLAARQQSLHLNRNEIQQIALELPWTSATVTGFDKELLRQRIVQGIDVLASSGFRYTQVTALESLAPDGSLLSLLITLNSQPNAEQAEPPATLMMKPAGRMSAKESVLQIHGTTSVMPEIPVVDAAPVLPRIQWLCEHRELCSGWMESFSATLELAEGVNRSIKRRRTVDVHFDSGSERGVFKSQMTAIGCGVLTFMMFGMVAYLVIAQLTDLPKWVLHLGRILWIAPLVIFLLAQMLLPIARDRSSEKGSSGD